MKFRHTIIITAVSVMAGCTSRPHTYPGGMRVLVGKEGNVVVELPEGSAFALRTDRGDSPLALVSNLQGNLGVLNVEDGGHTPRHLELKPGNRASLSFTTTPAPNPTMILDQDGDGIPDIKVENQTQYRMREVIWQEVQK